MKTHIIRMKDSSSQNDEDVELLSETKSSDSSSKPNEEYSLQAQTFWLLIWMTK